MGNSKKITGWVLLSLGTLMVILGGIFIALAVSADDVENQIATSSNFHMEYDRSYTYEVDSTEATSMIKIEVLSKISSPVELYIRVSDPTGSNILNRKVTTPITLEVDVLTDYSAYWTVKLIFIEDSNTISDVNVRVYGQTPSDSAASLCCAGGILPSIGIILVIVGIILVVVGAKQEKRDIQAWNDAKNNRGSPGYPTQPYNPNRAGSSYSPSYTGSYPDRSQTQGSYGSDPSPSLYPPPASPGYQPEAEQRNPYDTRDGIRIGYVDK